MGFRGDFRRELAEMATRELTSEDPRHSARGMDRQTQKNQIAEQVVGMLRRGYDPMVIMEMLIAGLAWFADNHGVSRAQLIDHLKEAQMPERRSLLWTPPTFGTPSGDGEE
jgi:hypothetical protein